ncbi:MAG: hypothetical protein KI785_15520 [Devosiaceae bacterium]|nr:hypothetical protein [Devosiaceae bacterium MH13]
MSAGASSRLTGSVSDGRRNAGAVPAGARPVDPRLTWLGLGFVWLTVFSSFFVLFEPAPYEFLALAAIGTAFLFGMTIPKPIVPLLGLLVIYVIGGFVGIFIAPDFEVARFQISVTAFLALTTIFFACFVAKQTHTRMALIVNAWQWGAIFASIIGVIGYFNVAGTAELFTLYGRARGSFQDPNVFGPFVVGAVVFAVYTILSQPMSKWFFPLTVILIGALGILLSFSRGAWGYTAFAAVSVTALHFILTGSAAERFRIIVLSMLGLCVLATGVVVALSIPAIGDLFTVRANVIQSYDGGELGRFGRHVRGFAMSIEHPLGLGAFGFREVLGADPHNVYLNALMVHGWMGFFAYMTMVLFTVYHLLRVVLYNPPFRSVAVPLMALFVGMMLVGTFIDTDRWRHFFLLLGLSWGVIAASMAQPYRASTTSA